MTRSDHAETLAEFEASFSPQQSEKFFVAVEWKGARRPIVPPTIATIFRKGEFLALQKLGILLSSVLHGEQKYRFPGELRSGRMYRGVTKLTSQHEKTGQTGTMCFYVFQTDLVDAETRETCVECVTTILTRS